jgi:Fimbrial assembly protein (PilN)
MARQINLVNPALRKTRDALSAQPLSVVAAALIAVVAIAAVAAHVVASRRHAEAEALTANQKQAQEALLAATQSAAAHKPDPRLAAELERTRLLVTRQQQILQRLDNGSIGNTQGFAEFLRGFARRVPHGLWLTGFTIGAGGADMEVRGRMLSPELLPEYVRRLNAEPAFRGHGFAGLEIQVPRAEATATEALPPYTEFVLSATPPGGQR